MKHFSKFILLEMIIFVLTNVNDCELIYAKYMGKFEMKRVYTILIALVWITTLSAQDSITKIIVYYFHYTQRCSTCMALETETQKALGELFPNEMMAGSIRFASLDYADDINKEVVQKYAIEGQTLLLVSRSGITSDLTDMAFSLFRSKPEEFRKRLFSEIETLING